MSGVEGRKKHRSTIAEKYFFLKRLCFPAETWRLFSTGNANMELQGRNELDG
jgi:hypothetical protein